MLSAYQAWQRRRRAIHEGTVLAREARRGLTRYHDRLTPGARAEINEALQTFAAVVVGIKVGVPAEKREASQELLVEAVNGLDRVLDTHLSFARKSTAREYVEAIGTAVLIALFLRAFVVEAFKIPSGSMIPTLQVGDHIFVNKFIYGVRVPFTNYKIGTGLRKPRRGEVIVFIYPKDPEKDFIKRIVAVAGDTVQLREGVLYVNNEPVAHEPGEAKCAYEDYEELSETWQDLTCNAVVEHVGPNTYTTIFDKDVNGGTPQLRMTEPIKVPEHSVFCMGDNRDHSSDSRFWGFVDEDLIKGKAMVIWWSQGKPERTQRPEWLAWMREIPVVKWFYGARYSRMFHLVR
jgi:signal peptidase I